jgi:methylase of polypeptide subunit release factors
VPYGDGSFNIIVFDPPYASRSSNKNSFVGSLYNNANHHLDTVEDVLKFYSDGMTEAFRLLKNGGYLMVKCMDEISGGKQKRNHISIWNDALRLGFIDEDLFILVQNNVPVMRHNYQLHARKNNSFLWIFKKR